jgi:hypothetical protein
MNSLSLSLSWITALLNEKEVPFQIAGGLAVRAYGSARPLMDIDISEIDFPKVHPTVAPYITFGPQH